MRHSVTTKDTIAYALSLAGFMSTVFGAGLSVGVLVGCIAACISLTELHWGVINGGLACILIGVLLAVASWKIRQ